MLHTYTTQSSYLDEVLGVGGKDWVEHEVVEVGVVGGTMVVKVDKVLNVIVRANIPQVLKEMHTTCCYCGFYLNWDNRDTNTSGPSPSLSHFFSPGRNLFMLYPAWNLSRNTH